jgi:hypothetical protein
MFAFFHNLISRTETQIKTTKNKKAKKRVRVKTDLHPSVPHAAYTLKDDCDRCKRQKP